MGIECRFLSLHLTNFKLEIPYKHDTELSLFPIGGRNVKYLSSGQARWVKGAEAAHAGMCSHAHGIGYGVEESEG